jgi:hypothetical protein
VKSIWKCSNNSFEFLSGSILSNTTDIFTAIRLAEKIKWRLKASLDEFSGDCIFFK